MKYAYFPIVLAVKDPTAVERANLLNMAKLSIKGLIESALSFGRTLDSDYPPLQQFFVVMEHCLKHGLKGAVIILFMYFLSQIILKFCLQNVMNYPLCTTIWICKALCDKSEKLITITNIFLHTYTLFPLCKSPLTIYVLSVTGSNACYLCLDFLLLVHWYVYASADLF